MTPEPPQPLAAVGPWALLLFAVAALALVCSGCHHTEVTCHGPVTVEAAVDAQAGIKGACRAACDCDRGECMGCTEIAPLSPEQFDVLRKAYRQGLRAPQLRREVNGTWSAWVLESDHTARCIGRLPTHHGAAPQYDPRDTFRGHGCPPPDWPRTGCGLKVE